jgi:hypothetical protein
LALDALATLLTAEARSMRKKVAEAVHEEKQAAFEVKPLNSKSWNYH